MHYYQLLPGVVFAQFETTKVEIKKVKTKEYIAWPLPGRIHLAFKPTEVLWLYFLIELLYNAYFVKVQRCLLI